MKDKIAFEEHAAIRETVGETRAFAGDSGHWDEFTDDILDLGDKRLGYMDAAGIELAILSLNAPGVQCVLDTGEAVEMARKGNDALAEAVARHNAALGRPVDGEPIGQADLLAAVDQEALHKQVDERLAYVREKVGSGELVDAEGETLEPDAFDAPDTIDVRPEWRVVDGLVALRCGPYDGGLYRPPIDSDFDRNRCSTMREGEIVQLLARWPNGMFLARAPYTIGWVDGDGLSSRLERADVQARIEERDTQPLTRRAAASSRSRFSLRSSTVDTSMLLLKRIQRGSSSSVSTKVVLHP